MPVGGHALHAQPVIGEDPQGQKVGRLLDEHQVAGPGEQRTDQVQRLGDAARDEELVGGDLAAVVAGQEPGELARKRTSPCS